MTVVEIAGIEGMATVTCGEGEGETGVADVVVCVIIVLSEGVGEGETERGDVAAPTEGGVAAPIEGEGEGETEEADVEATAVVGFFEIVDDLVGVVLFVFSVDVAANPGAYFIFVYIPLSADQQNT